MPEPVPNALSLLLCAETAAERDRAWSEFLEAHSGLMLHVARSLGGGHDDIMDRYTFMLESLERDDYRRLRGFVGDGRCTFSTWLIVVARRLCLDHHRKRYGRLQSDEASAAHRRSERRQLVDLVSDEAGLAMLEAPASDGPEEGLQRNERSFPYAQTTGTPYGSNRRSAVTITSPSTCACAISIRSNGSRW